MNQTTESGLCTGLFVYFAGLLENVNLENSYIGSKHATMGSLAAILEGTIDNCTSSAYVCSAAIARNLNGTGGIVGNLNGGSSEVLNCRFSGKVSSSGNPHTGGIVGDNLYGYVARCVNEGTVTITVTYKVKACDGIHNCPSLAFTDINVKKWYHEATDSVIERKLMNGFGSGKFGPNDQITREQLTAMLWRFCGSPKSNHSLQGFTDATRISSYAKEAIAWANEKGILNGYGNGILAPKGIGTRAETAQLLMNYIQNVKE